MWPWCVMAMHSSSSCQFWWFHLVCTTLTMKPCKPIHFTYHEPCQPRQASGMAAEGARGEICRLGKEVRGRAGKGLGTTDGIT